MAKEDETKSKQPSSSKFGSVVIGVAAGAVVFAAFMLLSYMFWTVIGLAAGCITTAAVLHAKNVIDLKPLGHAIAIKLGIDHFSKYYDDILDLGNNLPSVSQVKEAVKLLNSLSQEDDSKTPFVGRENKKKVEKKDRTKGLDIPLD